MKQSQYYSVLAPTSRYILVETGTFVEFVDVSNIDILFHLARK